MTGEIKPGEALGRIGRYIVDLEADRDRASDACATVQRERDEAVSQIRALYRGYVLVLENARDRIRDLGGECDSVDVMENGDPKLIEARTFLARYEGEVK